MMRRVLAAFLAALLLTGTAVAQTDVQLRNPPSLAAEGGAPSTSQYYLATADAALPNAVVPSADARTLLGHTFVQMLADIAAQAADADLTTYAGITPSANTQTLLGGADFAAWRTNLSLTALATTTPGIGIATALGINVGSAGAPVLFNGALGTPSSGVGTNLTGVPISTGVSGLGAGVATAAGNAVSGSGSFCLTTSCTMVTPTLGVATATSVDIGGTDVTISRSTANSISFENGGDNVFAASYQINTGAGGYFASGFLWLPNTARFGWSSTSNATAGDDTEIARDGAAATFRFGLADANPPVAQVFNVQDAITGTDIAGATFTINGSRPTGAGAGGNIVLATALAGASATTQRSTAAALTVNSVAQAPQVNTSTVAGLSAFTCGASQEGSIRGVTDALAPTFLAALTGGGTVHTPVYCNGSAWVSF